MRAEELGTVSVSWKTGREGDSVWKVTSLLWFAFVKASSVRPFLPSLDLDQRSLQSQLAQILGRPALLIHLLG